mmetsp:Transcript_40084/g.66769  ORF Transcript_40084/g.66769 Transcript_40084/m.66769 type:complete len:85 (-) Transcript_40084:108-362(-)
MAVHIHTKSPTCVLQAFGPNTLATNAWHIPGALHKSNAWPYAKSHLHLHTYVVVETANRFKWAMKVCKLASSVSTTCPACCPYC